MAVRSRTVHVPSVAEGDAEIEDYLTAKGVRWEFLGWVSADRFDRAASLNNQARFEPLHEEQVENYSEAMKRGDVFPPAITYGKPEKLVAADGNHRMEASARSGRPIRAYRMIDAPPETILSVMYERNAKHGLATSEQERIHHALNLIDRGMDIKTAAAVTSLPKKVLDKASAQRTADQRFLEAGLPSLTLEKLSEPIKRRLAQIYTDEGFVPLVELTIAAKLTSGEVWDMVTQVNEIRSGAKQAAWVKEQRELLADRIEQTGGGSFTRRPTGPRARVSMAMSTVLNIDDWDAIAQQYVGPEREEAAKRMRETAKRLNNLAKTLTTTS